MKKSVTLNLKTLLIGLVLVSISIIGNAQNVNIPDANFKAALVGNASVNTNLDTEIQVSEANVYGGFLNVNSLGITDLTGIEEFINIDNLNCSDNQLTSLDVSGCTNLQYLYCNNNLLTSLNVSANTSLLTLFASDNQLTSIDVSNNGILEGLFLENNNLTAINVSNNTSLTNLYLTNNQLTTINLSNNGLLQGLLLNGNQLTSLSLFNLLNLSDFRCANNPIAALDLSSSPNLSTFVAFNMPQLNFLNIANGNNTNISFFNATGNPLLTCVQASDVAYMDANFGVGAGIDAGASYNLSCNCFVNITDANFKAALVNDDLIDTDFDDEISCAEAAAYAGTIDVSNLGINDLTGIEAFVNINTLICPFNSISSIDISNCLMLEYLDCRENYAITNLDLQNNALLNYLDCSMNLLSSLDISNNLVLGFLNCNNNQLTNLNVSANTALYSLDCSYNQLTSIDITSNLSLNYLSCGANNDLVVLDVSSNVLLESLYYGSTMAIMSDFVDISNLTSLKNLSCGLPLGSQSSFDISNNTALISLQVWSCDNLTDLNVSHLSALQYFQCQANLNISSLDLSNNPLLTYAMCLQNPLLDYLNIKNGNNINLTQFSCNLNPSLTCIQVDDPAFMNTNWSAAKDAGATYSLSCACFVNIPDPIFKAALVGNDLIDTDFDDEISCAEAAAYTGSIQVNFLGVSDLTGIEAFTNITELNCGNNSLTILDLSANTQIQYLYCNDNLLTSLILPPINTIQELYCNNNQLTNINLTDVSGIVTFDCSNNNGLNSIDVTGQNDLQVFNCEATNLSSLNVTQNTQLAVLNCSNNQLTGLDLSGNSLLQELTCEANNITGIDLTFIPLATYINCAYNQISSLDLSANTALNRLYIGDNPLLSIPALPNPSILDDLGVFSLGLSSIDLSVYPSLSILNCDANSLTSIDFSGTPNIGNVSCASNNITALDFSSSLNLYSLNCSNNSLTALNVQNGVGDPTDNFNATNNPSLTCIQVNDVSYMNANWSAGKDAGATYDIVCSPCILNIPDANFKAALVADNAINTDLDAEISCAEALAYTGTIDVQSLGITDLTGIESFTGLTGLNCDNNLLTSLDVSSNVNLIFLSCIGNQLTSLNIDNCTSLTQVFCNLNQITSLNTSTNASLYELYCQFNQISTLDVSNNLNLGILFCLGNGMSALDVTNNPNLLALNFGSNSISSIDLSANTLLYSLSCQANQLSSIDLSSNNALTSLICYSNPSLSSLNVQNGNNNNMTFFDATSNASLTCIQVDNVAFMNTNFGAITNKDAGATYSTVCPLVCNVNIPDANFKNALLANASINTDLDTEISCAEAAAYNGIINVDFLGITDLTGIEAFINITELYCSNNNLTSINISNNTLITSFACEVNQITNIDLTNNTLLNYIDVTNNQLTTIDLSGNGQLVEFLCTFNSITSIDFSSNPFLETIIAGANALTTVNLSNNPILKYLTLGQNLTSLDLSNLPLLEELSCSGSPLLTSLDFSNNPNITRIECASNGLTSIDISGNPNVNFIEVQNNNLSTLNIQNGNNSNLIQFNATGNASLSCIQVDDATYMNTNWSGGKDAGATFSTVCPLVCTVNIPDANFKNALVTNDLIDTDFDDEISCAEAAAFTGNIDVNSLGIADMTGIEAFTNISSLRCQSNVITTGLNISNAANLVELFAFDNQLTTIDLSGNLALQFLAIGENQLTSVDLSQNTALLNLAINDNPLTGLDLSQNILLQNLTVFNTTLTNIDVSNNPDLLMYYCPFNQLTSVDFSNNLQLNQVTIYSNQLTSIDVSMLNNLTSFECYVNQLASLNMANGNNSNLILFNATSNPNLACIQVDNVAFMNANWSGAKDATAGYSTDCSCIVNIPDANFRNALLSDGSINTDGDGVISCAEAIAFNGSINVSGLAISDLTGIDAFVNLINLDCSFNQLTVLDVSSNLALTQLFCDNNQLSGIDVSANVNLTKLHTSYNPLFGLNVSANLALTELWCDDNQLNNLDVSFNTSLTELYCSFNQITNLNLASNTALTKLWCDNNPLTGLDVSSNVALSYLWCYGSGLSGIDVSANVALTELNLGSNQITNLALSTNTALNYLFCADNLINSLDLSANTALAFLFCNNNQLTSLNIQNGNNSNLVAFDATNNPSLTCIQVDNIAFMNTNWSAAKDAGATYNTSCACVVNIPDANFKAALVADLTINTNADTEIQCAEATSFNGTINVLGDGISDLTGIEAFVNLTELNCQLNNITSINLSANLALQYLYCNSNFLTNLDVSNNVNLIELVCRDNQLTTLDVSNNNQLLTLYCDQNQLSSLNLSNNPLLESLDFNTNSISTIDLSNQTNLTSLFCYGNNLSALNLSLNTNLRDLQAGSNPFISIDLSNNLLLETVDFQNSQLNNLDLSTAGSMYILSCQNSALQNLNIQNGNNNNLTIFNATNNPSLTCIQVDNVAFMNTNWSSAKDAGASYNTSCACIVNIPDANFKAALVGNATINTNLDAEIQCAEATAFAGQIIVNNLGITDLTGIEAFTNIFDLNCSGNSLTSLNLASNTSLLTLSIIGTGLNSIDISNNTLLQGIDASNNNFNAIDLSNNPNLTEVRLNFNNLSNIDISNNNLLQELSISNNNISNIDISNLTLLDNLNVSFNQLSALDISNSPLLNLLYCFNNQITSLDLTTNSALTVAQCNNNNLSSFNIQNGNNLGLTDFGVNGNSPLICIQVDDVTYMNTNWSAAKDATAGYSVDCSCTVNIPDNNFRNALLANASINTNSDGVISCTEATGFNGTMDVQSLGINDLTGIEAFINLNTLICIGNNISSIDLSSNTALVNLDVSNVGGLVNLNVTQNASLKTLYTGFNSLTTLDVSQNPLLEELNCAGNSLTVLDVTNNPLLKKLYCSNSLTSLDVTQNPLLEEMDCTNPITGIDITQNPLLRILYVNFANFTSLDLSQNNLLEELYSSFGSITNLDLSNTSFLNTLDFRGNQCSSINVQNGNNSNLVYFDVTNSPTLTCIQVDDVAFMNTNWSAAKDAGASYSTICGLVADFVGDITNLCEGGIVNFSDLSLNTTGSTSYLWDFGDGNQSNITGNVSHNYLVSGIYSVSLTVTDGTSDTKTINNYITVLPKPAQPSISVSDNCGTSVLTVSGLTDPFTWTDGNLTNPRTVISGGTYGVFQTASGCNSDTAFAIANPLTIPSTSLITGNMIPNCSATSQNYSVVLNAGSSYAWTVPAGANITSGATGPNNNIITVDFGTNNGFISVVETNGPGCSGVSVDTLVFLQGCSLAANFNADVTSICEGAPVTFTDLSTGTTGSTTYSWDFGSGASPATAIGQGPHQVFYSTAGSANVSLTITDGSSNTLTQNNYITINTPTAPGISITSDIPSPCPGTNINLTASITNPGSGYTVTWYRDGSFIGNGNSINTTVVNPSEAYQAEYQTFDFCNSPQAAFSNIINAAPQGLASNPGLSGSGAACPGAPISFTGSYFIVFGPVTPIDYQWKVNGVIQASTVSPFVSSTLNDGDLIEGSMNYDNGCGIVNFSFGSVNAVVYPAVTSLTKTVVDATCGNNNGSYDVTGVTGGTAPYTYSTDNVTYVATTLFSNLSAGAYTIYVKDANNCIYNEAFNINSIGGVTSITNNTVDATCGSANGSYDVTGVTGGTAPYTYSTDNVTYVSTTLFSNLSAGAYTIYVKDANNCIYNEAFNINNIGGVTSITNNTVNETCGAANGSYDVTGVTGGTAPYTYSTDNVTYIATTLFSNLSAGAYTIYVKDANNCIYNEAFNINNIGGVTSITSNTVNETCGAANGSYDVTGVTGGTAPYTYSTDNVTYVATTLFSNLSVGAYTIYVKDANNCIYNEAFNINNIGGVTSITNNTVNETCGAANGSYDVTGVTGGTAPYTYSTDNVTYVATTLFSNLSVGAYTIYVKDANNCIYNEAFNINNIGGVTSITNNTVDATCGSANGSYDVTGVTGGTAPYTYSTDNVTYVATTLFSNLSVGAYTIYVKDANNCIYNEAFNINNLGGVTSITNNTVDATCGSANGSYDVTGVTGGTAPYTYSTDNVTYVATTLFTNLSAGAYTIYVKDANNCVYNEAFNINNIGGVTSITNNTVNETCGAANGSYDVTGVTGGTAPYTYSTDNITYVATTLFSNLSAGAYTIYVKDANNCIYNEAFNINNLGGVTSITNNTVDATCGSANGSYDVTGVTGGTAPYTYSTDNVTYVATTLFTNLSAGAYTIYVKDANNCVYNEAFNINNIGGVTSITNNTVNETCGAANGSYDVTGVTGGTAPYTYSTDNITYVATTLFSNLSAGAYTIYVKDANNCIYNEAFNINNLGGVTSITNNTVDATCGSANGSYDVTGVTGGTAPYTYSTDNVTYVATTLFSGLSAGAYTIYVKDANSCVYNEAFNINNIGGVTSITNNTVDATCGSANGSYDVTGVTGGTAPYTYSTDNVTYVATTLFSNLSVGAYTIYVKDANNCIYNEAFNINNIGGVTSITNNTVNETCGAANGSYDVTGVTGGTAPYTYSTDNVTYVATTLFSNLSVGAYTIYVKDANNCIYNEAFNINNIGGVTSITNNTVDATCGSANGSYDVTGVTGGTAPYTYSTDNVTYVATTLFSNLSVGAYTIYVKDANNCIYNEAFNINNLGGVTSITNNTVDATCGSANGSYDVTGVTGGTAPYTYSTDNVTYVATTLFTNLSAGAYTIYVKDANNCVYNEAFNINNIGGVTSITNNTVDATCGSANGSYDVTGVTGGTAPYTYSTDNVTYVATTLFTNLSAGAYTIYVKDANNCIYNEAFNINNIGGVTSFTNNTVNETCGAANGSYDVTGVTGGTAPYTYSTDNVTYVATTLFSNLSAGAYTIYVKDANNCVYNEAFNINNIGGVTSITNNTVNETCGAANGSYDVTGVTGGTAPYTYSTDNITYVATTLFSNLSAGAYTIYVKDANNCVYNEAFNINNIGGVTSITNNTVNETCGAANGSYDVTGVTGGTAPYTYSTDNITYVATTLFSNLSAGAYTIYVKDANNCVYNEAFNINNIGGVTSITNNTVNETCGAANGSYDVTGVTGGTAPYTYSTDNITYVATTLFSNLSAGAYTIYVKDANNCVYNEAFNINNIGGVTSITSNTVNETCGAANGSYDVTGVTGGTAPYTYSTDNITYVATTLFSNLSAGAYTIYVKDANNCVYNEAFNINNLAGVTAISNNLVDASCSLANGSYDVTGVTGGVAPFSYSIDGITFVGTTLFNALAAGSYTIYVQDNNNCIYSEPFTINTSVIPVTSIISGNTNPICNESGVSYSVNLTSGSSYAWSVPAGTVITSGLTGPDNNTILVDFGSTNGNIDVVETNSAGCVGTMQSLAVSLQGCGLAANFTVDTDTICEGASVTFTDLSTGTTGSTTYLWDFGAGAVPSTATGAGPHLITYIAAGAANVSLTITDGTVSTLNNPNFITVNPVLSPSVSISVPNSTICGPTMLDFNSVVVNGGANPTYQWQLNGADIINANGDTLNISTLVETDIISLNVISNETCLSVPNASSNQISINDSCDAIITTLPVSLNTYCAGSNITVNYNVLGTVNANNIFIAQMSDALGSFVSPVNIGQLTSVASGSIPAIVPVNTNSGAQYRVRVVSNSPSISGTDNGSDITVHSAIFGVDFSIANLNLANLPMEAQFVNNTPNPGQYTFNWYFGDGSQAVINTANVYYTYNYNGSYNVSLVATDNNTGCSQTIYDTLNTILCSGITTNACNHPASINAPSVINGCAGSEINLSVNNFNPAFTYQWHKNGAAVNGANYQTLNVNSAGFYSVTVFDTAGCPKTSNPVQIAFNLPAVSPPVITVSGQVGNCGLVNATLHASGNFSSYIWNNGASTDSININQSGVYSVIGQGALGCDAQSQPFSVSSSFLPTPTICMVTVDTLTNHHLLMWEKPVSNQIQSFAIYKEIPANSNTYQQIAVLPYDSLSEFLDTNSNASVFTDRYRLSFIDTCNGETSYSDFVRAIGLRIFPGVGVRRVLSWNSYVGAAQNITSYIIYSGPDYNNLNVIGTALPGAPPFEDTIPVAGLNTVYRIHTELSQSCESTRAVRNRSVSNGNGNGIVTYPEAIQKLSSQRYKFNILPNPNNGKFVINWDDNQIAPGAKVWIESMYGNIITAPVSITDQNKAIAIDVESGVYFIRISSSVGEWVTRMVIVN